MDHILNCTITHLGVPIGTVALEMGERQGLGTLDPFPGYDALRPIIQSVSRLGAKARVELLTLPPDVGPDTSAVGPAASLAFELWDDRGGYVPVDVVRLVELQSRPGITVLVEFGRAGAAVPARNARPPYDPGASNPTDV